MKLRLLAIPLLLGMSSKAPLIKADFYPCKEADFKWAMVETESGHNPKSVYMEAWGEESLGLYQLSVTDSLRYEGCPNNKQGLFNPDLNTKCAENIMSKLRILHPTENIFQNYGRYWSCVRNPKYWPNAARIPWNNFVKYAATRGCKL